MKWFFFQFFAFYLKKLHLGNASRFTIKVDGQSFTGHSSRNSHLETGGDTAQCQRLKIVEQQAMGYSSTTTTTTPRLQFSSVSHSLYEIHVFISSTRVYITYIRLPARESLRGVWHRRRSPHSSLQHITLPPTKNTFHPSLVKRIPICPGAKFQPCFLGT